MKKVIIIIGCIVGFVAVAIIAANFILGNQANATYYKLGDDRIASVKEVVAKRDITSVETSISGGVTTKTIIYKTDPSNPQQAAEDIAVYFQYLVDNEEFLPMVSFDGLPYEGGVELKFGKESVDEGKIIILDITYDSKGYTLVFSKGEGTLTEK